MTAGVDPELERRRAVLQPIRDRLAQTLVALDFDGTLAPIVSRPEDARALPEAATVLTVLARRVARVAVVTGRPAADAVEFGGLSEVPGLLVLGHYGLERWEGGQLSTPAAHPGVARARSEVERLAAAHRGVTVEDKGHSVALHTRRADDPAGAFAALTGPAEDLARSTGLQLTPGRLVLELRPPEVDKGTALTALVRELGATAVVYGGDDLGDLPALAAVRRLAADDDVRGVVICSDAAEASAEFRAGADLVVPGPAGVLAVLRELAA